MKQILFFFILFQVTFSFSIYGQNVIFHEDFQTLPKERLSIGINGKSLDLTEAVSDRSIIRHEINKAEWNNSFTLSVWLKGEKDFESYNIIDLQTTYVDSTKLDWKINKQVNHTWSWELQNGEKSLDYKPGNHRQLITDNWSLITMAFNGPKEEVALYYNGKQVAIYSLEGMVPASTISSIKLKIGGEEKSDLGQWETFNGLIEDIKIYNNCLNENQINDLYSQWIPSPKIKLTPIPIDSLKVMTYNIWHGGNETGKGIGYKRIAEVIKNSNADIITMQETYGSGARIADELGYYFYLRSSNISIMSRYPIKETLASYKPFNNGNALITIGNEEVIIASVWLNYPIDYWSEIDKGNKIDINYWLDKQEGNKKTMEGIINSLKSEINNSDNTPIIVGGDFNTGSHLDWIESTKDKNAGHVMPFPTGKYMQDLGFKDTFREIYPDPKTERGITWTPINPSTHQDRIDFIFVKGKKLKATNSKVIDKHTVRYPSDHAAVITTFQFTNKKGK